MKYIIKVIHQLAVFTSMPVSEMEARLFTDMMCRGQKLCFNTYKNQRAFFPPQIIEQSVVIVEELTKGEK